MGYFTNETQMLHTRLTQGLPVFYTYLRRFLPYNGHSYRVFPEPVPGSAEAHSIFQQRAFFVGTFVLLIAADDASLNASQEERPGR